MDETMKETIMGFKHLGANKLGLILRHKMLDLVEKGKLDFKTYEKIKMLIGESLEQVEMES